VVSRRWFKIGAGAASTVATISLLFAFLVTQYGFIITDKTGDIVCKGTYEEPCLSEFSVRNPNNYYVDIYSKDQVKLEFSPDIEDYALFVKDGRCSATGACRCEMKNGQMLGFKGWRCVDFTNKTKPIEDKVYNFRFPEYTTKDFLLAGIKKDKSDVVKWTFGVQNGELDPYWFASATNSNNTADVYIQDSDTPPSGNNLGFQTKFDISSIPNGVNISKAEMCVYWDIDGSLNDTDVNVSRITNQTWDESASTTSLNDMDYDNSYSDNWNSTTNATWACVNVLTVVNADYSSGNDNTTIRLTDPDSIINTITDSGDNQVLPFGHVSGGSGFMSANDREDTSGNGKIPYLDIEYDYDFSLNETFGDQYYEWGSEAFIELYGDSYTCLSINRTGLTNVKCNSSDFNYSFTTDAVETTINGSSTFNLTEDSTLDFGSGRNFLNTTFDLYGHLSDPIEYYAEYFGYTGTNDLTDFDEGTFDIDGDYISIDSNATTIIIANESSGANDTIVILNSTYDVTSMFETNTTNLTSLVLNDTSIVIIYEEYESGTYPYKNYVAQYDFNGNVLWNKKLESVKDYQRYTSLFLYDEDFFVSKITEKYYFGIPIGGTYYRMKTVKYNSTFDVLDSNSFEYEVNKYTYDTCLETDYDGKYLYCSVSNGNEMKTYQITNLSQYNIYDSYDNFTETADGDLVAINLFDKTSESFLYSTDEVHYTESLSTGTYPRDITINYSNSDTYFYPGVLVGNEFQDNVTTDDKRTLNLTFYSPGTQTFDIYLPSNVSMTVANITFSAFNGSSTFEHVYDFDGVTVSTDGFDASCAGMFTNDDYEKIYNSDNDRTFKQTTYKNSLSADFEFTILESPKDVDNITFCYEGLFDLYRYKDYSCDYDGHKYLYNYSSSSWYSSNPSSQEFSPYHPSTDYQVCMSIDSNADDFISNSRKIKARITSEYDSGVCYPIFKTDYVNLSIFSSVVYPSNITIDVDFDGTLEYNGNATGEFNTTNTPLTVDLNVSDVQDVVDSLTENYESVTIAFTSESVGIVQIDVIDFRYNLTNPETGFTGIDVTNMDDQYVDVTADTWGNLEVREVYNSFQGDIDYNVSTNTSWHYLHVRYTNVTKLLPYDWTDDVLWFPSSNSSTNLTPWSQTDNVAINNFTSEQTASIFVSSPDKDSCFNLTISSNSTKSDGIQVNGTPQLLLANTTFGRAWYWIDQDNCAGRWQDFNISWHKDCEYCSWWY